MTALADYFLLHNRPIDTAVDDAVVRVFQVRERTVRRSRGYAPRPIDLGVPVKEILACGGDLKNVFCLAKDHYAILSQHIGDLENLETLELFHKTLNRMKRFYRVSPVAVAHDLHPSYLSTRFALSMDGVERIGIQHHHAHIAACMAENHVDGKAIGVALDGTGYGTDGKIWGGEVMVCDYAGFERRFHLRYVPLAGGDTAVRDLWRSGAAYLRDAGLDMGILQVETGKLAVLDRMIERGVNAVETSSCGRLFDAVAAILGLRMQATFEGQGAMELEALARSAHLDGEEPYPYAIHGEDIDFRETIRQIVRGRCDPARAAARFHRTLAAALTEACAHIAGEDGVRRVCLSGGSFQNELLANQMVALLGEANLEVYLHSQVPPNDGGLCLGQARIADARIQSRTLQSCLPVRSKSERPAAATP